MIPFNLGKGKSYIEHDQMNREFVPVHGSSPWPGTVRRSAYSVPLLFRHVQILGDNLPNIFLFHVQLTCNHSNSQSMIIIHHLPPPLNVHLSPAC